MHAEPPLPDLTGVKVLIVEDEYYLAMEMSQEIERAGGTVIGPYAASEDGLTGLAEAKPDYALVDINLGEGPSFAVADALHERGVPFVFLTGYDGSTIPTRYGEVERLEKPTHRLRILGALTRLRAG